MTNLRSTPFLGLLLLSILCTSLGAIITPSKPPTPQKDVNRPGFFGKLLSMTPKPGTVRQAWRVYLFYPDGHEVYQFAKTMREHTVIILGHFSKDKVLYKKGRLAIGLVKPALPKPAPSSDQIPSDDPRGDSNDNAPNISPETSPTGGLEDFLQTDGVLFNDKYEQLKDRRLIFGYTDEATNPTTPTVKDYKISSTEASEMLDFFLRRVSLEKKTGSKLKLPWAKSSQSNKKKEGDEKETEETQGLLRGEQFS